MGKEGVEVRLGTEVENLGVMCMIKMSEDAKQLAVNMLHGRREIRREFATFKTEWMSVLSRYHGSGKR